MSTSVSQTYEASSVPADRLGMWWFLASEITIFGAIVVTFVLLRWHHPEWADHAKHMMSWAGALNTFILLTSSLTVVLAHREAERENPAKARMFLMSTIGLGLLFLCVKAVEYTHEIKAGFLPSENLYWGFYFFMTGLHALHVIIGLAVMTYFLLSFRLSIRRLEYIGLYWHLVDIVWIFLFPLLYLGNLS